MQGFVGFRIPIWLRRLITMAPAFAIVAMGVDATRALVMSQVVLSFALPAPMLALVWFTGQRRIMGAYANAKRTQVAAIVGCVLVLCLNFVLLGEAFGLA